MNFHLFNLKFFNKKEDFKIPAKYKLQPDEINDASVSEEFTKKIDIDEFISEDVSIGIYGKQNLEHQKTKLFLQSYNFFCRDFNNEEELLSAINGNLIQLLIVFDENCENFEEISQIFNKIRKNYSILELPIILVTKRENYELAEEKYGSIINSFILQPFQPLEVLSRIKILCNCRFLYLKNQEILKSEKEKSAFLYMVTHNVNTPLTVLLNEIYSLSEMNIQNQEIKDTITNIQKATNQIDIVIQNVLASYKISDGKYLLYKQKFNLKETIEIENIYMKSKTDFKNQSFEFECEVENPIVNCDENSLKGIYKNLLDNAIKYTNFGGKIKVKITRENNHIVLKVIDNGQGISKEKQIVLFKRFANVGSRPTGSEKSVGLGLYVVNEMCNLNNLQLEFADNIEDGHGCIFSIIF